MMMMMAWCTTAIHGTAAATSSTCRRHRAAAEDRSGRVAVGMRTSVAVAAVVRAALLLRQGGITISVIVPVQRVAAGHRGIHQRTCRANTNRGEVSALQEQRTRRRGQPWRVQDGLVSWP